jgi:uncharacterized protein YutE (UPF0331/DUF86 family)
MTKGEIRKEILAERVFWFREMMDGIKNLPIASRDSFLAEKHYVAAAESYLRRSLEALLDIGRHILAKGFAYPAAEYKDVARGLKEKGVLVEQEAQLMEKMAGYRNRMVHFYREIQPDELYEICRYHTHELERVLAAILSWVQHHG